MTVVLQLVWLALPVIAAGLVHLAVMKLDLLPGLRLRPGDDDGFSGKRAGRVHRQAGLQLSLIHI